MKPATANREMLLLRHIFSMAVEWHYLLESPTRGMKQLREENFRLRYLTFEEEAPRLIDACDGYLRNMVQVDLHSGLRKGELLALQWKDIDRNQKVLTVLNSKSGKSRHIPMNRVLTETILSVDRIVGSPYVFCKSDGTPFGDIKKGFQAARKRAGLEDVRFHDLRHTFASWLVIRGVPLLEVKTLLGHSSFEMTLRYAHLAPGQTARAVSLLEGLESMPSGQGEVAVGTQLAQGPVAVGA